MNTVKRYKKGGLNILSKKVAVEPPKGHYWVQESGRYFLVKGEYKKQPGASQKAEFKVASHKKS